MENVKVRRIIIVDEIRVMQDEWGFVPDDESSYVLRDHLNYTIKDMVNRKCTIDEVEQEAVDILKKNAHLVTSMYRTRIKLSRILSDIYYGEIYRL